MDDKTERLMNRCRAGDGRWPDDANDLLAECYGAIGRLSTQADLAAEREAELVYALESIQLYGSDTLSGRIDGPADAEWYREAVREMTLRAKRCT